MFSPSELKAQTLCTNIHYQILLSLKGCQLDLFKKRFVFAFDEIVISSTLLPAMFPLVPVTPSETDATFTCLDHKLCSFKAD